MIVHNPADVPVRDYPIQDPKTSEVALWSINPGETLEFPDYVGKYLTQVYGFLQRIVTKEQLADETAAQEAVDRGRNFSPVKVVEAGATNADFQTPAPTEEQLKPKAPVLTPVDQQMIGSVEGDEASDVAAAIPMTAPTVSPTKTEVAKGVVCPDCRVAFQNKAAMKTHYAHAHLKLPGVD